MLWIVPLLLLVTVACLLVWWWIPPVGLEDWKSGPPPGTWATWERQAEEWVSTGEAGNMRFSYRSLSQISIDLQLAVLVAEDINFFSHGGLDFDAIREAVNQWWAGRRLRGASTITQQLAKNLFLSNERSWVRKLREAKLAWWLERELGKRRILELYLNVIEFGKGVLGVEAAAWHYYGKASARLTDAEAAGLAATIPAPRTANPATATQGWQARREVIASRMPLAGWLRRRLASLQPGQ